MSDMNLVVALPLEADLLEQLRKVDPRLRVTPLGPDELALFWRRGGADGAQRQASRERLDAALAEAEVLFGFPPRGDLLQHLESTLPRLRWFQTASAGVDRLLDSGLLAKFAERGIVVTNASGLHATPIGEYILAAMLMFAKGAHRFIRAQDRHEWIRFMPSRLRDKTVGIVGMGAIGGEAARLARAFGCRVLGVRRSATDRSENGDGVTLLPPAELPSLLRESDYVVLAVPLTPETRHLVGEAELRAMKPTACLVNIARGSVVDEAALVRALKEGWIAGAVLDVFEQEPLPPESELWALENVIVSPHISGGMEGYNQGAVEILTDNLRRYLAGQPLRNVVDPDLGY